MAESKEKTRVLVAERDARVAADLRSTLTRLGYDVVGVARSLEEAARLADQSTPQIALIDATLDQRANGAGGGGGLPRARFPILYTLADDDTRLRGLRASHPGGYLLKPFADRELRLGIAAALGGPSAHTSTPRFDEDFFDISIDMLCCLGFDGYFARLNPAWERTLGFTRDELMSRPFIEFVHPDDRERTLRQNQEVRDGGFAHSFENRYLCKDGSYRWLLWNAAPDISRGTIYSVARDITERKRAEAALERLSTTDELTGLWNRRGFTALAERELHHAARNSVHVVVFYLDLDRFKEVNDTYGHAEGDRVLVDVARLLQASCRGSDIVGRLGGDEFVLFALDETGDGERIIRQRIQEAIRRLNAANRHPYEVGLTIGAVRLNPGDQADLNVLLTRADQRMYRRKRLKESQRQAGGSAGPPPDRVA